MNKLTIITLSATLITMPIYAQEQKAKKSGGLKTVIATVKSYDDNGDNKVTKSEYERKTGKVNFGSLDLNNDGILSVGEVAVQKGIEKKQSKDPSYKPDTDKVAKRAQKIDGRIKSRQDKATKGRSGRGNGGNSKGLGGRGKGGRGGGKGGRK